MNTRTLLFLFLLISLAVFAHEEQSEACSIDPNEPSGCGYQPGDDISTGDALDIKEYHITFNRPDTINVNTETNLAITVRNPDGQPAAGHNVQVQLIDPATSQDIYYSETYETAQGTYSFRYKPSFAGDYYIQYVIRADDEIIKPTFAIAVTDPRATYVFTGLLIAGIISALIGIYLAFKPTKKKHFTIQPVLYGVGFGILLVILGYSVSTFYTAGGERGFVVCGPEGCNLAVHWHSQFHITVCGKEYKLPLETGDLNMVHTHKELNRLHYHALIRTDEAGKEILEPEKLSMHNFFSQLDIAFNSKCFGDHCNGDICPNTGEPGTLRMTVNDVPNTAYENYSYQDGDDIHITFG